jgi:hypothetical protein
MACLVQDLLAALATHVCFLTAFGTMEEVDWNAGELDHGLLDLLGQLEGAVVQIWCSASVCIIHWRVLMFSPRSGS